MISLAENLFLPTDTEVPATVAVSSVLSDIGFDLASAGADQPSPDDPNEAFSDVLSGIIILAQTANTPGPIDGAGELDADDVVDPTRAHESLAKRPVAESEDTESRPPANTIDAYQSINAVLVQPSQLTAADSSPAENVTGVVDTDARQPPSGTKPVQTLQPVDLDSVIQANQPHGAFDPGISSPEVKVKPGPTDHSQALSTANDSLGANPRFAGRPSFHASKREAHGLLSDSDPNAVVLEQKASETPGVAKAADVVPSINPGFAPSRAASPKDAAEPLKNFHGASVTESASDNSPPPSLPRSIQTPKTVVRVGSCVDSVEHHVSDVQHEHNVVESSEGIFDQDPAIAKLLSDESLESKGILQPSAQSVPSRTLTATEATRAPSVDTRVLIESMTRNIADQARMVSGPQETRIELELDPPELGRVSVRLSESSEGISARIVVAQEHVWRSLGASLADFQATLADAGIDLRDFSLAQHGHGSSHSFDDPTSPPQPYRARSMIEPESFFSEHTATPFRPTRVVDIRA